MIESMMKIRPDFSKEQTVIIDAGIATKDNIEYLKQKKELHYIVVNRGKGEFTPEDTGDMRILFEDDDRNFKIEVKRCLVDDEVWLLCRSSGRLQKDSSIRGRQETLFPEGLESARKGLKKKGCTKNHSKVLEKISRLREKYPKASKVYEVTVWPDDNRLNPKTKAGEISWKKRGRYDALVNFDGCYVLRTDRVDMSDEEIWKTYIMLTRIESAFRCLKTSLGFRPIYHQLEVRSDAHMFITVIAYHILHIIESRLRSHGDHRSWDTIRKILSTHQRQTIEYDYRAKRRMHHGHIRLCSLPETEHKIIYHRLGLSDLPLARRYTVENS